MEWRELITESIEYNYAVTCNMIDLVDDSERDWKPETGTNWMTTGQLLMHITEACGKCFKGFVTGDWDLPEGVDLSDIPPEEMLPSAEKMPTIESIAKAKELLQEDKELAIETLASCSDEQLATQMISAPWDPMEMVLGARLLQMINHLQSHKSQLFYYLKLQGKEVNTNTLWGM